MGRISKSAAVLIAVSVGVIAAACTTGSPPSAPVQTTTRVAATASSVHADDLDLNAVIQAITGKQVNDAASLEQFINTTQGLNNVDADGDGTVDAIGVREVQNADGTYTFALEAQPSSGGDAGAARGSTARSRPVASSSGRSRP